MAFFIKIYDFKRIIMQNVTFLWKLFPEVSIHLEHK